ENPGSYSVWMERDGCSGMSKKVSITSKESLPEAKISGDKSIIFGQSAFVTIHFTGSGPWTFTFPGGGTFETLLNPYIFEVSPSGTTSYTLESVSNPCGYGTVEGEALISVIILGIENEKERDVLVFPNPTYDRILIKKNDFTEFKLGSAMGSRLMEGDLDQESTELNLSHLPS